LQYTFVMPAAREDVQFVIDHNDLKLDSSAGQWHDGTLTVPAQHAKNFTVTVISTTGAKK
jgi:hypothetical protein